MSGVKFWPPWATNAVTGLGVVLAQLVFNILYFATWNVGEPFPTLREILTVNMIIFAMNTSLMAVIAVMVINWRMGRLGRVFDPYGKVWDSMNTKKYHQKSLEDAADGRRVPGLDEALRRNK